MPERTAMGSTYQSVWRCDDMEMSTGVQLDPICTLWWKRTSLQNNCDF